MHFNSLNELYLSSREAFLQDTSLNSLGKCKKLHRLLLYNIKLTQSLCDLIDPIDSLEDFMFGYEETFYEQPYDKIRWLLTKPKTRLKRLNFIEFSIKNEFFDSIRIK